MAHLSGEQLYANHHHSRATAYEQDTPRPPEQGSKEPDGWAHQEGADNQPEQKRDTGQVLTSPQGQHAPEKHHDRRVDGVNAPG